MISPFDKLRPASSLYRIKEDLGVDAIVAHTGYANYMDKNRNNPSLKPVFDKIENDVIGSIDVLANSSVGKAGKIGIVYGGDAVGIPRITHERSKGTNVKRIVVLPFCGKDCIKDYENVDAIYFIEPPAHQSKSNWGDECPSLIGVSDAIFIFGGNDLTYFEWGSAIKEASNRQMLVIPVGGTGGAAQKLIESSIQLSSFIKNIKSGEDAARKFLEDYFKK